MVDHQSNWKELWIICWIMNWCRIEFNCLLSSFDLLWWQEHLSFQSISSRHVSLMENNRILPIDWEYFQKINNWLSTNNTKKNSRRYWKSTVPIHQQISRRSNRNKEEKPYSSFGSAKSGIGNYWNDRRSSDWSFFFCSIGLFIIDCQIRSTILCIMIIFSFIFITMCHRSQPTLLFIMIDRETIEDHNLTHLQLVPHFYWFILEEYCQ